MLYSQNTLSPQAERLRHSFKEQLDEYGEAELPIKELVEKLMTNTIKDDESLLPGIYPPEREYQLSAIFIEADTPLVSPSLGFSHIRHYFRSHESSQVFYEQGNYGTRSTSGLSVMAGGEISFYQKYLEEEMWKEHTVTYQIEKNELDA